MTRLLYAGPSIETLYAQYATRRRIDTGAPVTASGEVMIAPPAATVWPLLADPVGWGSIDPAIHDLRLAGEVLPGTQFTWRNGRTRIRSRFAVADPEHEITWTGVSSGAEAVSGTGGRRGTRCGHVPGTFTSLGLPRGRSHDRSS